MTQPKSQASARPKGLKSCSARPAEASWSSRWRTPRLTRPT